MNLSIVDRPVQIQVVQRPVSIAPALEVRTVVVTPGAEDPTAPPSTLPKALLVDFSHARFWFLGYADRIKRIDNDSSPPLVRTALIEALSAAWPDRQTLTYS